MELYDKWGLEDELMNLNDGRLAAANILASELLH